MKASITAGSWPVMSQEEILDAVPVANGTVAGAQEMSLPLDKKPMSFIL